MRLSDLVITSFRNLWRRKLRTFLTTFASTIGIMSIVVMASIGLGQEKSLISQFNVGKGLRTVEIYSSSGDGYGGGSFSDDSGEDSTGEPGLELGNIEKPKDLKLNDGAIERISNIKGVKTVIGIYSANAEVKVGRYTTSWAILGLDLSKSKDLNIKLESGRLPTKNDNLGIVIGETLKTFYAKKGKSYENKKFDLQKKSFKFYFNSEVIDENTKRKPEKVKITGYTGKFGEYAYSALMDISDIKKLLEKDLKKYPPKDSKEKRKRKKELEKFEYSRLLVITKDISYTKNVLSILKKQGYQANSSIEYLDQAKSQVKTAQYILVFIGSFALIAASFGITNAMIMSIYERTREIGVMKVMGAKIFDILKLFLIESGVMGLLGGVSGISLSLLISYIINSIYSPMIESQYAQFGMDTSELYTNISYIPLWLILGSALLSFLIGLIAGILPAIKATRLSALEAIKTNE